MNKSMYSNTPRLVLLAVALLLGGCMSLAPEYRRPPAPVASSFDNKPSAGAGVRPTADLGWQQFFQDARLKALVGLALQNNRDLRIAVLNIEQARAQFGVRRSDQWPTVNAGINGSRGPAASRRDHQPVHRGSERHGL